MATGKKLSEKKELMPSVTDAHVAQFQAEGVTMIPGLFAHLLEPLQAGVAKNLKNPGPYAAENVTDKTQGRFFDDYCNWRRIPEFQQVVHDAHIGEAAAKLMQSKQVQVFHDHVLVKEAGTSKATPWHQDSPYYFVDGEQTLSFWVPLDPVTDASLRCVVGSHQWEKPVLPTRWLKEDQFYDDNSEYQAVPDPDKDGLAIAEWAMQPGDAVAFHFRVLHGARGNTSSITRRAFSLRVLGDDARYVQRPGPTSPPFPGHNMQPGERLRKDWFPIMYEKPNR